jgi:hypothetical protein
MWIKRSPMVFPVLSVACFFLGLVLFTYSSEQVRFFQIFSSAVLITSTEQGNFNPYSSALSSKLLWLGSDINLVRIRTLGFQLVLRR